MLHISHLMELVSVWSISYTVLYFISLGSNERSLPASFMFTKSVKHRQSTRNEKILSGRYVWVIASSIKSISLERKTWNHCYPKHNNCNTMVSWNSYFTLRSNVYSYCSYMTKQASQTAKWQNAHSSWSGGKANMAVELVKS